MLTIFSLFAAIPDFIKHPVKSLVQFSVAASIAGVVFGAVYFDIVWLLLAVIGALILIMLGCLALLPALHRYAEMAGTERLRRESQEDAMMQAEAERQVAALPQFRAGAAVLVDAERQQFNLEVIRRLAVMRRKRRAARRRRWL